MSPDPLRIVIAGHHPDAPSGTSRIGREIGRALQSRGHRVAIIDLLARGAAAASPDGFEVYSVEGTYATRGKAALVRAVSEFHPDLVLSVADMWDHYYLPDIVSDTSMHWVSYVALEQAPCPAQLHVEVVPELIGRPFDVRRYLEAPDRIVAHNEFGQAALRALVPGQVVDAIPHGVNTDLFHPAADASRVGIFGPELALSDDTFLAITVARNLERKGLDLLLQAWSRFVCGLTPGERLKARLYLHVPNERGPHDLGAIITLLECGDTIISNPSLTVDSGLDDAALARLYQVSNLYLSSSRAEGFGLPIIEAMASGTPALVTDYAGPGCIASTVADSTVVRPVRLAQRRIHLPDTTWWAEVDVAEYSLAIAEEHRRFRQQTAAQRSSRCSSIAALAKAHYSWSILGPRWGEYLEQVVAVGASRASRQAPKITRAESGQAAPVGHQPLAPPMSMPNATADYSHSLTVIIPAYGSSVEALTCVRSLRATASRPHQYIIQDDCSPGVDLREHVNPSEAECYRNERNLGYAGNSHAAVEHATGDILLFVNQDVWAEPALSRGWDEALLRAFADPGVGAVGGLLLFPPESVDAPSRVQSCGGGFDEQGRPVHLHLGTTELDRPEVRERHDVSWMTGAALATRREAWNAWGGFDRAYGRGYFEDADYCLKLRQAGLVIRYEPDVKWVHQVGTSGGVAKAEFERNEQLFLRRWVDTGLLAQLESSAKGAPNELWRSSEPRDLPSQWVKVNLGCNQLPLPGWTNVDVVGHPGVDVVADLEERWPWSDGSVHYLRAFDVFEHLADPIHTMNEAYRVLAPGGLLEIFVPSSDGRGAFQDPTHCSFWNRNSFSYYSQSHLGRLYPEAIRCDFATRWHDTPPDPSGVIHTWALCQALKSAAPLVDPRWFETLSGPTFASRRFPGLRGDGLGTILNAPSP